LTVNQQNVLSSNKEAIIGVFGLCRRSSCLHCITLRYAFIISNSCYGNRS